jgi:hypothetical protein
MLDAGEFVHLPLVGPVPIKGDAVTKTGGDLRLESAPFRADVCTYLLALGPMQ